MPDKKDCSLSDFYLTRRGMLLVRWRAVQAFVTSQDPSPYHDPVVADILRRADNPTALYLAEAFDAAYENAALAAREMSLDRAPDLGDPRAIVRGRSAIPARNPALRNDAIERAMVRKFNWFGQMAYAKGIDRSPTHDRRANKELKQLPNNVVLILLRAWEDGWDDGYDYMSELALERRSILDAPKVLSTRTFRQANETIKKK